MDKQALFRAIEDSLRERLAVAERSALQAYEAATHEENVAENKYDTLGLEASYLAQGQAERVREYQADLQRFAKLPLKVFAADEAIGLGAVVRTYNQDGEQVYFLSPVAGGLRLTVDGVCITLVTPSSPVGQALLGAELGDEIILPGEAGRVIEITAVY